MDSEPGGDDSDPSTRELKLEQARRESEEQRLLSESGQANEAKQHERRRDKAAYLKEKLAERERSERDAANEG